MDTLSLYETRVLGALIEKEHTTPDNYPLSLNALTIACNQKSSRDPVLTLSQDEVQNTVDALVKKLLVINDMQGGKRGAKIRHRFGNTAFSKVHFTPQQLAIITLLFLRGPQTPGELRTRAVRQYPFIDVQEVETTLTQLINHELRPFVVKLNRAAGQSACRYAHLFSGPVAVVDTTNSDNKPDIQEDTVLLARVDILEQQVVTLKAQLVDLQKQITQLIE